MIKRGSSVDQVGLTPQSIVAPENQMTGRDPIALPDAISPDGGGSIANLKDGGKGEVNTGGVTNPGPKTFKANTGYENP